MFHYYGLFKKVATFDGIQFHFVHDIGLANIVHCIKECWRRVIEFTIYRDVLIMLLLSVHDIFEDYNNWDY